MIIFKKCSTWKYKILMKILMKDVQEKVKKKWKKADNHLYFPQGLHATFVLWYMFGPC